MILNLFTFINGWSSSLDLCNFFEILFMKIKIWRKLIFLTNFNATLPTIIKQLSANLSSRVETFK